MQPVSLTHGHVVRMPEKRQVTTRPARLEYCHKMATAMQKNDAIRRAEKSSA